MPKSETPSESDRLIARGARDEAQLILGQIHGLLWLAASEFDTRVQKDEQLDPDEPGLTADDIRNANAEVDGHFGKVHAALNTGVYDEELVRVGFAGAQGHAKRKGFVSAISRVFGSKAPEINAYIPRLRRSLRWSKTLIGSITTALKKEIERVPGAAAAGEAIKEFIEVLLHATEPQEEEQKPLNRQAGKK